MVYKRYIKRKVNGEWKTFGPYYYESYRDSNGINRTRYILEPTKVSKLRTVTEKIYRGSRKLFVVLGILCLVVLSFFLLSNIDLTGKAVMSIDQDYSIGEQITGDLKLLLESNEFIPGSTKVVINNAGEEFIFLLSDLVKENLSEGEFYLVGTNVSGFGLGYGISEIEYPKVAFVLDVYRTNLTNQIGEEIVEPEVEIIPEEQPQENITEIENETIEEPQENVTIEEPAEPVLNETEEIIPETETSETPTETPTETITPEVTPETSETPTEIPTETITPEVTPETTPSETPTPEITPETTKAEKEIEKEVKKEEKQEPASEPETETTITGEIIKTLVNTFNAILSITGNAVIGEEISGEVAYGETFTYDLAENQTARIISSEQDIELTINNNQAIITTNYTGGIEKEILIDLSNLNLTAKDGEFKVSLVYEGTEIVSASKNINVENLTIVNETIQNITLINVSEIIENITTKQYKAIIGRPVKSLKILNITQIKTQNVTDINITLPKKATNISVLTGQEIKDALKEIDDFEETVNNTEKEDLVSGVITGQVSLDIEMGESIFSRIWKKISKLGITGKVIDEKDIESSIIETNDNKIVEINEVVDFELLEEVAVGYYTDAPLAVEENLANGKRVTISAPDELNYTDILAYSLVDKQIKLVDAEKKIRLYWYTTSESPIIISNETIPETVFSNETAIINESIIEENISNESLEENLTIINETVENVTIIVNETIEESENTTIPQENETVISNETSSFSITGQITKEDNKSKEKNNSKKQDIEETNESIILNETVINNSIEINYSEVIINENPIVNNIVRVQVGFDAYDLDNDSYVDYIEWIVPHLSNQTYDIIYITKAEHLDENRTFIEDISDEVKYLDGNWSKPINDSEYVRVTFEIPLDNTRDVTFYGRSATNETSTIEVFTQNGNETLAVFENIQEEKFYKIYLTELNGTQDVFDLKINGSIEFDQILDPAPTIISVKINSTTNASTENIKGYCNATDGDGDDLAYQYQWYNGSTVYFNGTLFKEGSISAGYQHSCGIRANDSRVLCWGEGAFGRQGDGSTADNLVPTLTSDISNYSSVSAGYLHTCGIRANDSRVLCWGDSLYGILGDGQNTTDRTSPYLTTDSSAYSSVSAGQYHTCGIRANDLRVLCWGDSANGKLGDGQTTTDRTSPYLTTDSSAYSSVSAGIFHTCGIRANDSRVLCWGASLYGRLGDGQNGVDVLNPNLTTDTSAYSSISAGYEHTCGIRASDGRVLCWGESASYQLGDGQNTLDRNVSTLTTDISPYKKGFTQVNETLVSILSSSNLHAGEIWKLSCRAYDFTSYSSSMNSSIITILGGPPTMATVKINSTVNTKNDSIYGYCNGTDKESDDLAYQYQWYNGSTVYFNGTLFKEGSISAGNYHTCGIRANDSRVLCWGGRNYGALGDGNDSNTDNLNPNVTTDTSSYISVSAGYFYTCGIRANDSRVLCWGSGLWGKLGDGSTTNHSEPNLTTDNSSYTKIYVGYYHTCGIRANDSRVLCWGQGHYGQLGDGQNTTDYSNPRVTTDSSPYISISAGYLHTCGIRTNDSRVLCWGAGDYGILGDGQNTTDRYSPYLTTDTSAYKSVSIGRFHTCGIRANDSRVLCWGDSANGKLGDGQVTIDRFEPYPTTDTSAYAQVETTYDHTCGIRANDSRALCWGDNSNGNLGTGNYNPHTSPYITTDTSPYGRGFSSSEEILVSILGNAYINAGQNWSLGCRSYDFTDYSSWMNSSILTINFPPVIQTVKTNSTTNKSNENIKGYCNATDTDGNDLIYNYTWYNGSTAYINGTLFKEGTISAGYGHSCGIRANDSRVLCWGAGSNGRQGDGQVTDNLIPTLTTDISAYSSVSAGGYFHTCGIRANDSRVLCWGDSAYGQIGDGQITTDRTSPYLTTDSSAYSSISAGELYTCGIRANDSRVLCWGDSAYGQLGDGQITTDRTSPYLTTDSSAYSRISAGGYHTCGIRQSDSRVLCWGFGTNGALGDGSVGNNLEPTVTTDISSYLSVSAGGDSVRTYGHTCGIRTNDSRVLCWGESLDGRLGDGQDGANVLNPNLTKDSSAYKKGFFSGEEVLISTLMSSFITAGESWKFSCRAYDFIEYSSWVNSTAMTILSSPPTMSTVKINSTTNTKNDPIYGYCNATDEESDDLAYQYQWYNGSTVYFNGTIFKEGSISTGYYFSCGIRANDSRVLCWGQGLYGQLGDGQNTINRTSPTLTTDNSSYKMISAGYYHTCGIRANDSRVLCWGETANGRVGDGQTTTDRTSPYLTTDTSAYSSISAGLIHTCGIRQNDSRVLCWGESLYGRLGDGQNGVDVLNPNLTTDSSAYTSVNAGGYHSCGIRANDSRVLCWGYGNYGQLGDGNNASHSVLRPNITTDSSPYKKGFSSSEEVLVSILGNAYLNVGQNWSLGCRSYDFTSYSDWMNSSVMTINTAPVMQTVKINSTTNSSTENIKGFCNATDFQGREYFCRMVFCLWYSSK